MIYALLQCDAYAVDKKLAQGCVAARCEFAYCQGVGEGCTGAVIGVGNYIGHLACIVKRVLVGY